MTRFILSQEFKITIIYIEGGVFVELVSFKMENINEMFPWRES